MEKKLAEGVALMVFYVMVCVAQNELFQAVEKGGSSPSNATATSFDKPFFIVMWNHSFMVLALPPMLCYLALAEAPHEAAGNESDGEAPLMQPGHEPFTEGGRAKGGQQPPRGWGRLQWHLDYHDITWLQLCTTGAWSI